MNNFLVEFGGRLRFRRRRIGLSQSALGRAANRSKQLVSAWEHGRAEITASALAKISQALNIDPGWLLFGSDPKQSDFNNQSYHGHSKYTKTAGKELKNLRRENQRLKAAIRELLCRISSS